MKHVKLLILRQLAKVYNRIKTCTTPKAHGIRTYSDISYIDDSLDWHKLDIYVQAGSANALPAVIYIHGGGWSISDKNDFRYFCQRIAMSGYVVFNVNYRLAPEYKHPAQLLDVISAMAWVKSRAHEYGADAARIFLAGDSSGAHLASLAACVCTNAKLQAYYQLEAPFSQKELSGCILFSGAYDILTSVKTNFLLMKDYVRALLGVKHIERYSDIDKLCTIQYITSDYPPCLVSGAAADKLFEESTNLIKMLDQNDVAHTDLLFEHIRKAPAHEYQIAYHKPIFRVCINASLVFMEKCMAQRNA